MKLSVIIVSYNVKYFLEQCLLSVETALSGIAGEVWVVDNNSADGSAALVRDNFPWVKLIASRDNLGFSKGNNLAIRQAAGEYILLLNPDTLVEEDTFRKVIGFMDEHPDAGGLGVYMIDGRGNFLPESKRGLPTPEVAFYKMSGLSALFPRSKRFGRYHLGFLDRDQIHKVDVLSGAFMLMRKETLDKTGLLDEDFFMYGEDIDLSYRITQAGYANYYFPGTRIIHYKGESTSKSSVNYVLVFYNAMRIFAKKHFTGRSFRVFNLLITLAIYGRAGIAILARFLRKSLLPLTDAVLLYAGLSFLRYYWEYIIKAEENLHFAKEVQTIAFPVFVLIWLLSLALHGGYDKPVKLSRVLRGVLTGSAIILVGYAILPEELRFSRAVVLLGSAWAIIALPLVRLLFHLAGFRQAQLEEARVKRIAVAGTEQETEKVSAMLKGNGGRFSLVGWVSPDEADANKSGCLGVLDRLGDIIRLYGVDEVIFCARDIPARDIIRQMSVQAVTQVEFKIAPPESMFIIGSNSIESQGELYGIPLNSISKSSNRRSKRLFDFVAALILLCTLPLHLLLVHQPGNFLKNLFKIIAGKLSWVGFNVSDPALLKALPDIRKGIISPGQHGKRRVTDPSVGEKLDQLYARDYRWQADLALLARNYRYLGSPYRA